MASPLDPVFVGGSPRSGTTILGRLIGNHVQYGLVPLEAHFHVDSYGLAGHLSGSVSAPELRERMTGHYWSRQQPQGARGLCQLGLSKAEVAAAVEPLPDLASHEAAGVLVREILDRVAQPAGRHSWVEMSPNNAQQASTLERMLPSAGIVHIIRDGRDVAASMADVNFGPNNLFEALAVWGRRMRWIHAGMQGAERAITVSFDALVAGDRAGEYGRLLAFLGVADQPEMRNYFDEQMSPERAHRGRWRRALPEPDQQMFDLAYRDLVHGLRKDDILFVDQLPQD